MRSNISNSEKQALLNPQVSNSIQSHHPDVSILGEAFRDTSAGNSDASSSMNRGSSLGYPYVQPCNTPEEIRLTANFNYPLPINPQNIQHIFQATPRVESSVYERAPGSNKSKKRKVVGETSKVKNNKIVGYYYSSSPSLDASGRRKDNAHQAGGIVINLGADMDNILARVAGDQEDSNEKPPSKTNRELQLGRASEVAMQQKSTKRQAQQNIQHMPPQRQPEVKRFESNERVEDIPTINSSELVVHESTSELNDDKVDELLRQYFESSAHPLTSTEGLFDEERNLNEICQSFEDFVETFENNFKEVQNNWSS